MPRLSVYSKKPRTKQRNNQLRRKKPRKVKTKRKRSRLLSLKVIQLLSQICNIFCFVFSFYFYLFIYVIYLFSGLGVEIENAEVLYTDSGLYVYKIYSNGHGYDTSLVWISFFRELVM